MNRSLQHVTSRPVADEADQGQQLEGGRSRREVLEWMVRLGLGATVATSLSSCGEFNTGPVVPKPPKGPHYSGELPNIVLVLVDDLAVDIMGGSSRFPFLRTPHVDRLVREGVVCQNAFAPTSVCSPSRASLLTGTYAHYHGVRFNDHQDLASTPPNFPSLLREAGYETAFVGKWHMHHASSEPRLDFDYWLSFHGQGVYNYPKLNENGHKFQKRGYITDILTNYATRWLQKPRETPLCLILSHKAGHVPFTPAERHKRAFAGAQLPKPRNFDETFEGKPEWLRRYKLCGLQRAGWEACEEVDIPASLPLEPWDAEDEGILTHLRTLLAVDESVGALLEALESVDQLDNTIFVFTSDNGFLLGAHRLHDKRTMHEESIRIPVILRAPKRIRPASELSEMVLNIDLAPTLLEFAGVEVPGTVQGSSFKPLLEGDAEGWRSAFLYEYFQEKERGPGVPTILGIRTERWKYVHYPELPDDIDELYDLQNDPYELTNLIADGAYANVLGEMQGALQEQLAETAYPQGEARYASR